MGRRVCVGKDEGEEEEEENTRGLEEKRGGTVEGKRVRGLDARNKMNQKRSKERSRRECHLEARTYMLL